MSRPDTLYLWSIVPPPDVEAAIDRVRQEFALNFNSLEAGKRPVHMTLFRPFKLPEPMDEAAAGKFRSRIGALPAFSVSLDGFGFFETPRSPVVFIRVAQEASLKALNSELSTMTRRLFELDGRNEAFRPHFTIGYRDLAPELLPVLKKAYGQRRFSAAFPVGEIVLFRHNGGTWVPDRRFALGSQYTAQGGLW